jgi:hypothetical protein
LSLSQRSDPELDEPLVPRADLAPDHRPHPDRRLLPLRQLHVEPLRGLLAQPGELVLARLEPARLSQQIRQERDLLFDVRQEIGAPPYGFEELLPVGQHVRQ